MMGDKLLRYYDFVKQEGGLSATMKLAMRTTISVVKAEHVPDSPDVLRRFEDVIREILGPTVTLPE